MKALSTTQLKTLVPRINEYLIGARLQDVFMTEKVLWLEFYLKGSIMVGVHIDPARPTFGIFFGDFKKPKKCLNLPLILFLRAHAVGQKFQQVRLDESRGRVVCFEFGPDIFRFNLELRLIPHAFNVIGFFEEKKVALKQIRDLSGGTHSIQEFDHVDFNIDRYFDEWSEALQKGFKVDRGKNEPDPEFLKNKMIEKKEIGLERMRKEFFENTLIPWGRIGEELKEKQSLEIAEEWRKYIDQQKNLQENLVIVFEKYRETEARKTLLSEKINILLKEIDEVRQYGVRKKIKELSDLNPTLIKKASASGKRFPLRENVDAFIGKSAKDNLALLRRSNSWDYWIHLKDFPGSHAIIHRNKKENITQSDLQKVGLWVLEQTFGKKRTLQSGEKYEVIYAECRHVRPIKGDKLGRVIYSNSHAFTLRVD